jgi:hypothetical protein
MRYRQTRQNVSRPSATRGDGHASWTIWWDLHRRSGGEGWSRATEGSEADAVQRAEHFLKLGFAVYAIKDPNGAVFMDEAQIASHFARATGGGSADA